MVANARKTRKNFRRSMSSAKSINRRKPTANNQKAQILSLSKKVNRINRTVGARTLHATFGKSGDYNVSNALTNFGYNQLILPQAVTGDPAWTQIFDLDTSVSFLSTLKIKSLHTEYKVYPANEEAPIDCTVTLLAPKSRKILESAYNSTTGVLNLTSNVDYYINNGMVLINLRRWKLHHYKRTMTVKQDGTQELEMPVRSNMGKVSLRNLNWTIKNTNGNWNQVSPEVLPYYMRLFFVTFNNNSFSDLESPAFKHATIIKATAHQ